MTSEDVKVLLVVDSAEDSRRLREMLVFKHSPFDLIRADRVDRAVERLAEGGIDVVLLDVPSEAGGVIVAVNDVHEQFPEVPIIVLVSRDDTSLIIDSAKGGAIDYLVKGEMNTRALSHAVRHAVELARAERARQEVERSLRKVVGGSPDGMVIVDGDGIVQYVNAAGRELFARTADEIVGSLLGFPTVDGEATEVEILRKSGEKGVAEMRVVETEWEGRKAYLASLRDITAMVQLRKELREMSLTDELTGVHNRRGFLILGRQQLSLAHRAKRPLLLVFADVDKLKDINDRFGHQTGDQALMDAACVLKTTFRDSDIIARVGGDEFAIMAVEAVEGGSQAMIRRLRKRLSSYVGKVSRPFALSVSVGAVHYDPRHPCPIEALLAKADRLMYEAKKHAVGSLPGTQDLLAPRARGRSPTHGGGCSENPGH